MKILILYILLLEFILYKCVGYTLHTSFYIWVFLFTLFIYSMFIKSHMRYIIYTILLLYQSNIQFFFDFSYTIYKGYKYGKSSINTNNYITRILTTNLFNKNFNIIHNFDKIPEKPTIFLSNYVKDRVENLACMLLPVNLCLLIAESLKPLENFINPIITRGDSKQYYIMKDKINDFHKKGFNIFVYIEKSNSSINDEKLGVIRNGIFAIAKDLNISITPIAFDRIVYDKYGILNRQNYQIRIGDTLKVDNINDSKYKTRRFLDSQIKYFNKTKFTNCY